MVQQQLFNERAAVDRFLDAVRTATIDECDAWDPGVQLDATVPNWRFQRRGDVTALPHGHDAWVVGDVPVVLVDWWGASNYAG
jgi:hypothetical protein